MAGSPRARRRPALIPQEARAGAPIAWPAVPEFQTSPGMRDILVPDSARFRRFVDAFESVVEPAGYQLIIPPLLEDAGPANPDIAAPAGPEPLRPGAEPRR